jgi:hypothetical protein
MSSTGFLAGSDEMSAEARCCRELTLSAKGPSPFDRAIVLGWYDGPTEGLVRCGACKRVYRFALLDSVDEDRGIRIYSFASLPADSMDGLVGLLSRYMTPSWPMWVPLWQFPTETDRITVDRAVDELIARAEAPEFIVTTPALLGEIGDVKAISAGEAGQVHDWVSWMGLVRSTPESV